MKEYEIISTAYDGELEDEMNEAASRGFTLDTLKATWVDSEHGMVYVAVMSKHKDGIPISEAGIAHDAHG